MPKNRARLATNFFVAYVSDFRTLGSIANSVRGELEQEARENATPDESVDTMAEVLHHLEDVGATLRADPRYDETVRAGRDLNLASERIYTLLETSLMRAIYRRAIPATPSTAFKEDPDALIVGEAFFLGQMLPWYREELVTRARDGYGRLKRTDIEDEDIKMVIRQCFRNYWRQQAFREHFSTAVRAAERGDISFEETHEFFLECMSNLGLKMAKGILH